MTFEFLGFKEMPRIDVKDLSFLGLVMALKKTVYGWAGVLSCTVVLCYLAETCSRSGRVLPHKQLCPQIQAQDFRGRVAYAPHPKRPSYTLWIGVTTKSDGLASKRTLIIPGMA